VGRCSSSWLRRWLRRCSRRWLRSSSSRRLRWWRRRLWWRLRQPIRPWRQLLVVNVQRTASRYSQPGTHFLLYDTLGLRVAATDGLLSISFTCECFLRIFPGYRGSMRKSGISYPNQHIDSDCFFADLPVFELFSHTIPFDALLSSSNIDGRTLVFLAKACITNISRLRSSASMLLGEL